LPPQWATTEAARRGGQRPNKDYSHVIYERHTKLKAALTGSTVRQKAKRRKMLTLCSNLEVAEGDDGVGVDEVGDE
jgi:hypothetical protein